MISDGAENAEEPPEPLVDGAAAAAPRVSGITTFGTIADVEERAC